MIFLHLHVPVSHLSFTREIREVHVFFPTLHSSLFGNLTAPLYWSVFVLSYFFIFIFLTVIVSHYLPFGPYLSSHDSLV